MTYVFLITDHGCKADMEYLGHSPPIIGEKVCFASENAVQIGQRQDLLLPDRDHVRVRSPSVRITPRSTLAFCFKNLPQLGQPQWFGCFVS